MYCIDKIQEFGQHNTCCLSKKTSSLSNKLLKYIVFIYDCGINLIKKNMKKSNILLSVLALFAGITFLGSINTSTASTNSKKVNGAIVIGIPPGCDCEVQATSCYCVVKEEQN